MRLIEEKYQEYLKIVGLNYDDMPYRQRKETRRSFYAGFDYSIRIIASMLELSDENFDKELEKIQGEIFRFWKTEQLNQLNSN